MFASTFSLIFPLIGPAVVILLFLTLVGELVLLRHDVHPLNRLQHIDSLWDMYMRERYRKPGVWLRFGSFDVLRRF